MITEAYCSFEVAKLLKEKGFDEEVSTHYLIHLNYFPEFFHKKDEFPDPEDVWLKCPTHQMAMAWLREKGIYITIYMMENHKYGGDIFVFDSKDNFVQRQEFHSFNTYDEAVEAALKDSLENLI